MIRKQGQWNPKTRSKWCAECSTWVAANKWPSHNENHVKVTTEQWGVPAVTSSGLSNGEPAWPDWQKLYEEQTTKLHKAEMQVMALKKMGSENEQIRKVLAEMGRAIVTTYGEY